MRPCHALHLKRSGEPRMSSFIATASGISEKFLRSVEMVQLLSA